MIPALSVANYFVEKGECTPMKVQKLVYFANGWYMGMKGEPLVLERVQAWKHGPVIPEIYKEFARYGSSVITAPASGVDVERVAIGVIPTPEDAGIRKYLDTIWRHYGNLSGAELSSMTHEPGSPWSAVREQHGGELPLFTVIPDAIIRAHFEHELQRRRAV